MKGDIAWVQWTPGGKWSAWTVLTDGNTLRIERGQTQRTIQAGLDLTGFPRIAIEPVEPPPAPVLEDVKVVRDGNGFALVCWRCRERLWADVKEEQDAKLWLDEGKLLEGRLELIESHTVVRCACRDYDLETEHES